MSDAPQPQSAVTIQPALAPASFPLQVWLLTGRLLKGLLRNPFETIPNLAISVFFLLVYDGALGGSAAVESLTGGNYLNFILPVVILFASISGSASGLTLVEDLESGYFRRQLGMPISRVAIVLAAMIIGAIMVLVQAILIIGLGLIMGADPATGAAGILVLLGFALLWGLGFAGYSVATGLLTGSAKAAQAATFVMFPLMFLSPVFLPQDQLKPWIQAVSTVNPTTYLLDAMRSVLIEGWVAKSLLEGLAAGAIFALLMMGWAVRVTMRKTRG